MYQSTVDVIAKLEKKSGLRLMPVTNTSGRGKWDLGEAYIELEERSLFGSKEPIRCSFGSETLEEMRLSSSRDMYKGLSESYIKRVKVVVDGLLAIDMKSRQAIAAHLYAENLNNRGGDTEWRHMEVFNYLGKSLFTELGFKDSFNRLADRHKRYVLDNYNVSSFSEELVDLNKEESTDAVLDMASVGMSLGRDYSAWNFDNYLDILIKHPELFKNEDVHEYLLDSAVELISKRVGSDRGVWLNGAILPLEDFAKRVNDCVWISREIKVGVCDELLGFEKGGHIEEFTRIILTLVGEVNSVIPDLEEHVLISAIESKNYELFNALIDCGVDPSIKDKNGSDFISYHKNILNRCLNVSKKIRGIEA